MNAELTRATEVHGNESLDQAFDFSDSIIARGRPVIDELSLFELL